MLRFNRSYGNDGNTTMVMLIFLNLIIVIPSTQAFDYFTNCTGSSNYTQNSLYQKNLGNLLADLTSKASLSGFYYSSEGQIPDQVYGLYLCRGEVGSQGCGQCVYQAQGSILKECPTQIWAVLWYDNCMLRFSNEPFYHQMDDFPSDVAWNPVNISTNETRTFSKVLNSTMKDLRTEIVNSKVKFSTKIENVTSSQKLYTLGQCTLDLSADDCGRCLKIAIGKLPMMLGGRTLLPSCNVRFEVSPFYGSTVYKSFLLSAIMNSTPTATRDKQKRTSHIAIAVSFPVIFAVLLLAGAFYFIHNRKAATPSPELEMVTVESLQYDFKTIRVATNNFSMDNKLGQGGFGVVYRGTLQNGQQIAVKRLSSSSGQGIAEFKTEVLLVAKLQHKNLVRLLGFCLEAQEKLLVYEFLPNSSLDKVLLDQNKNISLDWETRFKIIAGIARGLLYLHEDSRLKIIHRDLKSSNIMLDENMNPKISDFGLARLVGSDQIQGDTNRIVGTYGYMAPEYAMAGRFSVKSDVYSFGVLVLEIVSGHKCNSTASPFHEETLFQRAWRLWNLNTGLELVDLRLKGSFSSEEAMKCIHIGLLCIQEDAKKRPSMAPIVSALNGHPVALSEPAPPQLMATSGRSTSGQSSSTFSGSKDITEVYPR